MNATDRADVLDRFWAKVNKTDTCWLWTACLFHNGYGQFNASGATAYAHRFAYEACVGPIPDSLELDHLCRVRCCVNPAHLEPVTSRENTLRGDTIPAANAAKTHCSWGHKFAGENVFISQGSRRCRECHNRRNRERRARAIARKEPA